MSFFVVGKEQSWSRNVQKQTCDFYSLVDRGNRIVNSMTVGVEVCVCESKLAVVKRGREKEKKKEKVEGIKRVSYTVFLITRREWRKLLGECRA